VTLNGPDDGSPGVTLDSAPRRMVLRSHDDETGHSQIFSTLVSREDGASFGKDGHQMLVTLRLLDDDVPDHLKSGGHFDLWRDGEVGHGVVTRRLFS